MRIRLSSLKLRLLNIYFRAVSFKALQTTFPLLNLHFQFFQKRLWNIFSVLSIIWM
jgi:hypothetical protein